MALTFTDKWAILIGPQEYEHVKSLKYCTKDVVAVAEALQKYLGFPPDHVFTFGTGLKLKPLRDDIYHELGNLWNGGRVQPGDLLLFYFSGHGFRVKKDYLLPAGATLNALRQTGIELDDLVEQLTDTGCKNVVMFIDACRERIEGSKGVVSVGAQSKEILERSGIVTFFSCDPEETSYEIEKLEHGAFTYCFLEAIKSRECVTADDLYKYLLRKLPPTNAQYNKPIQKPYAIIAPAEKGQLQIFAGIVQVEQLELFNRLGDLFADRKIEDKYYDAAVDLLSAIQSREPAADETRKLDFIRGLSTGKLKPLAFKVAWDAIERRRILGGAGGTQIKSELEPLQ